MPLASATLVVRFAATLRRRIAGQQRTIRMRRPWCFLALTWCWIALHSSLVSATPARARSVSYVAPSGAGCPDAAQFLAETRARTNRPWTGPQAFRHRFAATIVQDGMVFRGSLEVADSDGTTDLRHVRGASCAEVASALTLMIAIAADREDAAAPVATPSSSGPRPWSIGASAMVSGGLAPDPAIGGAIAAQTKMAQPPGFAPTVGLMAAWLDSGPLGGHDRVATFRWAAARGSACVPVASFEGFSAEPCVLAELGALRGAGRQVARRKADSAAWFSGGLALRLTARAGADWFLQSEGALCLPGSRPEFVFERPTVEVHQVPWVVGSVTVGLGLRLP